MFSYFSAPESTSKESKEPVSVPTESNDGSVAPTESSDESVDTHVPTESSDESVVPTESSDGSVSQTESKSDSTKQKFSFKLNLSIQSPEEGKEVVTEKCGIGETLISHYLCGMGTGFVVGAGLGTALVGTVGSLVGFTFCTLSAPFVLLSKALEPVKPMESMKPMEPKTKKE